jgi:MFS family permease
MARAALATALGWQAYARSHDPLVLGLLGLAEFVPALLLALPAGHMADRHDRRLVAAVASTFAMLVALALALDAASGDGEVWPLYVLAACAGVAAAFEAPAFNPLLAASVPPAGLARVISLSSVTWQSATIFGPITAGALQTVGNPAPYLAAAAADLVGTMFLLAVPRAIGTAHVPDEARETATWRDVTAGIRFVRVTPALLGAISLDLAAVLFGGATALLPVFATDVLHVGADGNGLLRAAPGVGAITVGIALAAWPLRRRVGLILFGAVFVFGAATVVFGLSTSFPLSLLALAVLAGADMVSVMIRGTLVPLLTPPDLRGRVSALEAVFIRASNELGAFESGVAAAVIGAVPAVVLGGIASMAVAVVWCAWFPSLRGVDRFEDLPDPTALRTTGAAAR